MISEKDVVYISGPMTGMPFYNYFQFFGWAGMIAKEYHCEVLNPARHLDGHPYWYYMEQAEKDLKRATVVVLLDGWENSRGANIELHVLGKQVKKVLKETQLLMDLDTRMCMRNPERNRVVVDLEKMPKDPAKMTSEEWMKTLREIFKNG